MYVKIVGCLDDKGVSSRRGNPEAPVVPTKHWILEAEEVHYSKVMVPDVDSLDYGRIVTGVSRGDKDFEVIKISLSRREHNLERTRLWWEHLIARKCTLFLMNNEGKTIDRMTCL